MQLHSEFEDFFRHIIIVDSARELGEFTSQEKAQISTYTQIEQRDDRTDG